MDARGRRALRCQDRTRSAPGARIETAQTTFPVSIMDPSQDTLDSSASPDQSLLGWEVPASRLSWLDTAYRLPKSYPDLQRPDDDGFLYIYISRASCYCRSSCCCYSKFLSRFRAEYSTTFFLLPNIELITYFSPGLLKPSPSSDNPSLG